MSKRALPDGVLSGTVVSHSDAVRRLQQLRDKIQDWVILLTEAVRYRDWATLGYGTLADWFAAVIGDESVSPEIRGQLVLALRQEGYSLRAIGGVLQISKNTAQRDLDQLSHDGTVDDLPERITGLDGRDRPATRPAEQKQAQRDDRKRDIELDKQAEQRLASADHRPPPDVLAAALVKDPTWTDQAVPNAPVSSVGVYFSPDASAGGDVITFSAGAWELPATDRAAALTRAIAALQRKLLENYA